jgi:hypothetical protein
MFSLFIQQCISIKTISSCLLLNQTYNFCSKLRTTFVLINDGFSERNKNGIVLNFAIKIQPRYDDVYDVCFHVHLTHGIYLMFVLMAALLPMSRPLQLAVAAKHTRAHAHATVLIFVYVPLSVVRAVCNQCSSVSIYTLKCIETRKHVCEVWGFLSVMFWA